MERTLRAPTNATTRPALKALQSTQREMARYHAAIVARCAAIFAAMVLCHLGWLPVWGLVLANLVLYPGIYLRVHDIGHGSPTGRFGWAARFVPASNPIWGGTRVFAEIHREHHKYLGTDRDPWLPYYAGHPLRALFFNFIEPEYSFRAFAKSRGVDRELLANVLFNAACLAAGLAVFQWTYVIHVFSLRVVHMTGIFFFNFYTHREDFSADAPIGAWERAEDLKSMLPWLRAVWGRDLIDGVLYHNRHHCMGQVHVPVQNYKHLPDTGNFTRYNDEWPIREIQRLPAA